MNFNQTKNMRELINTTSHEHIWQYKNFPNPVDFNEHILVILRKDRSVLQRKITAGFFVIIVLFFLKLFLQNYNNLDDNTTFINMMFYFIICGILLKFSFFCHNYFMSFWAITSNRIIEHNQDNFFRADIRSIWYKNINKTKLINESASNTINNVADLVLEIKGEGEQIDKITLNSIPNPHQIEATIKTFLS
jgi:ABC-type multidrug transport system fused ATPase/permease subunit